MSEFLSIADARQAMKGSIVATVTNIGDLKSGTNAKGDWTMKIITLADGSGREDMAVFNEEIKLFKLNYKYEIVNPWWKVNEKNELAFTLGQYAKVKAVSEAPIQETIDDEAQEIKQHLDEQIQDEDVSALVEFTLKQNKIISKISEVVRTNLEKQRKDTSDAIRGDVVWVRTKEIYNSWQEKNHGPT